MYHHKLLLVASIALLPPLRAQSTQKDSFWQQEFIRRDDERQMQRLGVLIRTYFERTDARFEEMVRIKSELASEDYSIRRSFEKGYVMGDVIETYRKGLIYTKKQMVNKRYTEADRLRYLSYVQSAYVKVYHLAHMMHEADPKFGMDNTGQMTRDNMGKRFVHISPTYYNTSGYYYSKELEAIRQSRVAERKEKVVKEKRLKMKELLKFGYLSPGTTKKTTTNWWPVAYGWDIDYYW